MERMNVSTVPVPFVVVLLVFVQGFLIGCSDDDPAKPKSVVTATVAGTLTLPSAADGKSYYVLVDTDIDGDNGQVKMSTGICGSGTSVNYQVDGVPVGTYYVYGAVFTVSDGSQGPQTGDYFGIYGGTLNNLPAERNVTVASGGVSSIDIVLAIVP